MLLAGLSVFSSIPDCEQLVGLGPRQAVRMQFKDMRGAK